MGKTSFLFLKFSVPHSRQSSTKTVTMPMPIGTPGNESEKDIFYPDMRTQNRVRESCCPSVYTVNVCVSVSVCPIKRIIRFSYWVSIPPQGMTRKSLWNLVDVKITETSFSPLNH